jgi:hypothetical protein
MPRSGGRARRQASPSVADGFRGDVAQVVPTLVDDAAGRAGDRAVGSDRLDGQTGRARARDPLLDLGRVDRELEVGDEVLLEAEAGAVDATVDPVCKTGRHTLELRPVDRVVGVVDRA